MSARSLVCSTGLCYARGLYPDTLRTDREETKPVNFPGGGHRLDREKAIREQYDAASARMILLHLVEELGVLTGDDRFSAALDCLLLVTLEGRLQCGADSQWGATWLFH
jgi:hypothetical protein